jgi:AcrR family transcriptional regulator
VEPLRSRPRGPAWQEANRRRREEILERAIALFAEHGYSGTDTQLLADELHVGKGTLYRYFHSKEDMFLAAVDRGMRRLEAQVEQYLKGATDPIEMIRQGVRGYLAFFESNPQFVEVLIQERALFKDRRMPTYSQHREARKERWRGIYQSLIVERRIREMPPERIAEVVGDLLYGTMFTNYFTQRRDSFEKQANDILDVILYGILSESERQCREVAGVTSSEHL